MVLTFEFVDEILKCDHSNESYLAALSCGSVKRADKILEGNKWKQQQKYLLFVSGSSYKFVPTKQEDQRNKTFLIDSACKRLFYL